LVGRTVANLGLAVPDGYFEALYDAFAQADAWRIFPDTLPTLDALRTHGLHVGIISNWDQRLRPLLDRLGLEARVDSLTISCEVGVEKPARKIYQAALAAANVPPQDSIHVGDSVQEDLEGATAAGMRALLVRQTGANDLDRVLSLL
jgi:putative hydrolase of the HAD superfamily